MIGNDFLASFLKLPPALAGILVLIFNFLSILIPAIKLNSVRNLFTNPAFVIGDFLAIPLAAFLMALFYKDFKNIPKELVSIEFQLVIFMIAFLLTLFSGIYFKLMKIYWVPHGTFYFLFSFVFFSFIVRGYGGVFYKYVFGFRIS